MNLSTRLHRVLATYVWRSEISPIVGLRCPNFDVCTARRPYNWSSRPYSSFRWLCNHVHWRINGRFSTPACRYFNLVALTESVNSPLQVALISGLSTTYIMSSCALLSHLYDGKWREMVYLVNTCYSTWNWLSISHVCGEEICPLKGTVDTIIIGFFRQRLWVQVLVLFRFRLSWKWRSTSMPDMRVAVVP